jgi:feruloyl esterase
MKRLVNAIVLTVSALVASASLVYAADTNCTGTLSGNIAGKVVVPSGASCTLSDATITGNVQVLQNASLTIDATQQPTTINGSIQASNCASALLKGGVTVSGSVQIQHCTQPSGFVGPGIRIGGAFQCTNNGAGCQAELGEVGDFVQVSGNGASTASDISLISVGGNLECSGNTPPPTHNFGPNFVAGSLQGQCAAKLGFAPTSAAPSCVMSTLSVPNLTVISATDIPASGTTPEYCQVVGAVATNGEGYGPGSAQFRLKLPVVWNNHFLFEGCGGNCGSITSTSVNAVDNTEALGLGYAVVNTDTGHEQDPSTVLLTWAVSDTGSVNMPAIIDFYYRAVHQVTVATKQYVEAYYSRPIDYAYFDGCSTGGRQSLMEGTHYPVDYDGLIVGDAAMAYDYGRTSTYKQAKAFIPAGAYIPASTLAQVDAAVKASCDAADGVTDGLIQNSAACSSNISTLVPNVLTAAQAAALKSYITLQTDPSGAPIFPGMPITDLSTAGFMNNAEISTPPIDPTAAEPWGERPNNGGGLGPSAWSLGEVGIKAYIEENESFDVNNDWPEKVSAAGNVTPDATLALARQRTGAGNSDDPFKLANFLNKGGKVILYHGGSDSLITPFRSTWYYEQLASLHGGYAATQDSVRLFIVPGMGHCSGGVSPNNFDTLQALHNWVTKGVGPEAIVATATSGRTMPLCKFPEEARYLGSGDVNLATNWTCDSADTRMLRVGGDGTIAGADTATALEYLYEPIGLNGK